jgi:YfiH family protein
MVQPLLASSLDGIPGIAHGFFTRTGGVSAGIYASLNCGLGSRDDPAAVAENRARVAAHLGAREVVSAYQVHGTAAFVVEAPPRRGAGRPRADALVTAVRGLALGVSTADCAPVLLADPGAGVVAAAHAGWRGALAGVVEAAVAAMEGMGAARSRIRAAVGPCIGLAAYEVGPEFEAAFLAADGANARFFARPPAADRPRFDLGAYVLHRLQRAGVTGALRLEACTSAGREEFFSYRRSRTANEADYGRQISAIVLT